MKQLCLVGHYGHGFLMAENIINFGKVMSNHERIKLLINCIILVMTLWWL